VTRLWTHNGIGDVDVVVAIPGGKRLQAVKTDANGNYSLAELPKGQRVEINYSLDGYQEKPTVHYVTLVDGANRDDARMAPDDAALAEYREYGAKLFQAETTASIDEDIRVILAHLPDEKRTAVTEGYASLAASGRDEDAHKQSIAALLLSFESASRSRTLRHIEESVSALAAQFAQIVPAGRVDQGPVVTVKTHLSSDPPSMRRIPHPA
ncbi:MAG TPA: carboxypeptidase-like regulatory domain-containing protein, partial [Thermoanaerobaculia bacterium]